VTARILIVEDEPLIAIDLEATLQTLGFDVCGCASNAREAVELATARRPDLVLMDVFLEDGCEGTKAAKWLNDACDIPVLFVSGHGGRDTLERIRRVLPRAQLFSKPVAPDRLAEAICLETGWNAPSRTSH
jgi:DNA-binding NarL/FixJ family response regulator